MSDNISIGENFWFIYIRENKWWIDEGICKCGYMKIIIQRDGTYVTSEPFRGKLHIFGKLQQMTLGK